MNDALNNFVSPALFRPATVNRSQYFKFLSQKDTAVFKWSPDGLSSDGPLRLTIELTGQLAAMKAYLFGFMFLYSINRPVVDDSESKIVLDVIHANVYGDFFFIGGHGDDIDLEDAIGRVIPQKAKRFVIQIFNGGESTCYLFVDNIVQAATGLLAVSAELEIEIKEDVDFENCQFFDLQELDLSRVFENGSTWDDVIKSGYKAQRLGDVLVDKTFSAVVRFE